jgi:ribosomal protein S18 acetylase RimI-like enzyme
MLTLRDAMSDEFPLCAKIATGSEIGERYGFRAENLIAKMGESVAAGGFIVVAIDEHGSVAGFAWVDPKGAFGSTPYLKLIAVDSRTRGSGAGTLLLEEYEKRTVQVGRFWTLLVSDFNARAIAFYERHGYRRAGFLEDFAVDGIGEILMVKRKE